MSSRDGKKFTGTAIVVLALFGVGGAVLDKMRNSGDGSEIEQALLCARCQYNNQYACQSRWDIRICPAEARF